MRFLPALGAFGMFFLVVGGVALKTIYPDLASQLGSYLQLGGIAVLCGGVTYWTIDRVLN